MGVSIIQSSEEYIKRRNANSSSEVRTVTSNLKDLIIHPYRGSDTLPVCVVTDLVKITPSEQSDRYTNRQHHLTIYKTIKLNIVYNTL